MVTPRRYDAGTAQGCALAGLCVVALLGFFTPLGFGFLTAIVAFGEFFPLQRERERKLYRDIYGPLASGSGEALSIFWAVAKPVGLALAAFFWCLLLYRGLSASRKILGLICFGLSLIFLVVRGSTITAKGGNGQKWVYYRGMLVAGLFSSLVFMFLGPEPEPRHLKTAWEILRGNPDLSLVVEELYWLLQMLNRWLATAITWLLGFLLPELLAQGLGNLMGFILSVDVGHGIIAAAYALPFIEMGYYGQESSQGAG